MPKFTKQPDGFTKRNFQAWLRKQPLDRTWDFRSNDACVGASFLNEINAPNYSYSFGTWTYTRWLYGNAFSDVVPCIESDLTIPQWFVATTTNLLNSGQTTITVPFLREQLL